MPMFCRICHAPRQGGYFRLRPVLPHHSSADTAFHCRWIRIPQRLLLKSVGDREKVSLSPAHCFQKLNGPGKPLSVLLRQQFCALPGQFGGRRQPDFFELGHKRFLILLRYMSQNVSHEMHLAPLPGSAWETFPEAGNQPLSASEMTGDDGFSPRCCKFSNSWE